MIDWRPAAEGARVLPFFSIFMNREWDRDKWELRSKGEVIGEPRKANQRLAIPGLLGLNPCGDPDWYARGMPFDPLAPVCVRDANGLPACCAMPAPIFGAIIGGKSGVSYTTVSPGGLVIGGSAGDVLVYTDATAGGTEVGGSAGDVWGMYDPTAGGTEVGGSAGDDYGMYDPTAGGTEVGGSAGDQLVNTDATAGGVGVGGSSGDALEGTDATAGGVGVGGASGDGYEETMGLSADAEVGGECGDIFGYPAPTVVSATIASDGVTLTVVWSEPVDFVTGDITIAGDVSTTAAYTSGSGTSTLIFTLVDVVNDGDDVTADYPAGLVELVTGGTASDALSGGTVVNDSTQGGPPVPGTTCATAGTMTIGSPATVPLPGGTSQLWLKCPQPGSAFKVTYAISGGFSTQVTIYHDDSCGTLGPGSPQMFSGCSNYSVIAGKTMFFKFENIGMSAGSVTVTVATGTC